MNVLNLSCFASQVSEVACSVVVELIMCWDMKVMCVLRAMSYIRAQKFSVLV